MYICIYIYIHISILYFESLYFIFKLLTCTPNHRPLSLFRISGSVLVSDQCFFSIFPENKEREDWARLG